MKAFTRMIRRSLSAKLITSLLICLLIPMLFFGIFYAYRLRDALMRSERRGVSQSVQTGLSQMDRMVREMTDVINALAISNQVKTLFGSPEEIPSYGWFREYKAFENLLETVAAKGDRALNVTAVSHDNKVYYTSAQYNSMLKLTDPLITYVLNDRNNISLVNRVFAKLDGNEMLTCGKAFYQRGSLMGVILVDAPLYKVSEMMSGMERDGIQVYVLNCQGDIIYANKDNSGAAEAETLKAVLDKGSESLKVDGADYMVIPAKSEGTGLSMLAMVPKAAVFSESNHLFIQMMAAFVGIILAAIAALVMITTGASRGLRQLNRAVSAFGLTGSEIDLTPRTIDEVGQLTQGTVAMSGRIIRLLEQIREDEHTKWQLEFKSLQSQINPHMIYNTLNTITYLAQLQNVSNIEEVSSSFVLLLRMISNRNSEYITIREELACVQAYMAIKRYNQPWDIACVLDVEEAAMDMRVLKLLMQPFVENAIVHGFSGSIISGELRITVRLAGEKLEIHITDNGAGIDEKTLARILAGEVKSGSTFNNVGVYNTIRRLELAYGERASFAISSQLSKGTDVFIAFTAVPMEA